MCTNTEKRGGEIEREKGGRVRVFVSGLYLTGGGTEPLGGSVELHGSAWQPAKLQWIYKCKGGEERSETYVGVLGEILSLNDAEG